MQTLFGYLTSFPNWTCDKGGDGYFAVPSPFSGITEPKSLLPFNVAGVAVTFHTNAVSYPLSLAKVLSVTIISGVG